jgi:hypothetical protein
MGIHLRRKPDMGMAGDTKDGGYGETADAFINLGEATADATRHGFDPFSHYWIARLNGRTTHYRPGKTPRNPPASEEPKD